MREFFCPCSLFYVIFASVCLLVTPANPDGQFSPLSMVLPRSGGENSHGASLSSCPPHLRSCSYLCYSHDSYGVATVPTSLWKVSQKAEADLWRSVGGSSSDSGNNDRAAEHWRSFENLSCLPKGMELGNVIEVGAGPWTQVKGFLHIRPDLQVKQFTIWEPSADRYMTEVASCSYSNGKALRKFDGSGNHNFSVNVISTGGESLISGDRSSQQQYDTLGTHYSCNLDINTYSRNRLILLNEPFFTYLAVSINVIEHVQDAFEYLTGLYVSLKPGGLLIFHDRYYSNAQITDGDVFHPIRIKKKVLDHFLSGFDIIYNNCAADYDGRNDAGYYVIARKK